MKHILVTGGAGFIGSHTVRHLIDRGFQVSVIDDLSTGFLHAVDDRATFYQSDFSDHSTLLKIYKKRCIDVIFHMAAHLQVHESVLKPKKYDENNVEKSKKLLQFCRTQKIRQFIFSSSSTLYGPISEPAVAGVTPEAPMSPYGQSKFQTEQELIQLSGEIHSLRLRYFNVAGADGHGKLGQNTLKASQLIQLASLAALDQLPGPLKIYGTDYPTPDGTCIRDYIHIDDLCLAHINALDWLLKEKKSTVFNVGYGHGYSVREVIQCMKKVSQNNFAVEEASRRPGDPPKLIGNCDRFRKLTGWKPKFDDLELICHSSYLWQKKRLSSSLTSK